MSKPSVDPFQAVAIALDVNKMRGSAEEAFVPLVLALGSALFQASTDWPATSGNVVDDVISYFYSLDANPQQPSPAVRRLATVMASARDRVAKQ